MSLLNGILFTQIPLFALLCNVFLLFTLLSAKKDGSIKSFMGLLVSFILWTGGAFLMRRQIYPGVSFWWKVSLTGIFLVPYMYFLLVWNYTEQKGSFLRIVWGIGTVILVVLNLVDVFMTSPQITMGAGGAASDYSVKWTAVFPIVFTLGLFFCIWRIISRTLKDDDMPVSYLMPLFIGVAVMCIGVGLNTIPSLTSWPTDTLACAINAGCIYYAFYKKRFYALSQMTSKGSMYILSLLVTALLLSSLYDPMETFLTFWERGGHGNSILLLVVFCSGFSILVFMGLNRLHDGLFVRDQLRREDKVHDFSAAVSSFLQKDEILQRFLELVQDEIPADHVYICMFDRKNNCFRAEESLHSLERSLTLRDDHPLICRLKNTKGGIFYEDFQKSVAYKRMWEDEKQLLAAVKTAYVLPFRGDEDIIGFALFSEKQNRKAYTYAEINFLESVAAVASIALKNASLYQALEQEALRDPLTGLFNRRTLNRRLEEAFAAKASPITLLLFNLDDFSLYNELYGNEEGDRMLKRFSEILRRIFGKDMVLARYGGKEFAVLRPYCDAMIAQHQAEQVKQALADCIANSQERIKKFLTFSCGICTYPVAAANANQLLSYANMAVFQIKQHGKNAIKIYNSQNNNIEETEEQGEKIQELSSTIFALTAAIDAKDHYTFNHSQCVSKYAARLAEAMGLAPENVEIIRQAGLLHDIGKIGIPDSILTKSGRLTPEEFSIMRQHVERSIEMIRHLPSLDYVIPAVLGHHERYDGSGYPRGISGEDIPLSARCLSIADSFDAMISRRSYKNSIPLEEALAEIERNLGTQFDPVLGDRFVRLIKEGKIEVVYY